MLDAECRVFVRHLLHGEADDYVCAKYAAAHALIPSLTPSTAFDRILIAVARQHPVLTAVADAHAALFARSGALRQKLVLLVAILESCPPHYRTIDRTIGGSRAAVLGRLVARVAGGAAGAIAGVVLLLPVQIGLSFTNRRKR
jgi:hypothetical protein